MLWVLVGLSLVSVLLLASGFVLVLIRSGSTTRQSSEEAGRELFASALEADDETTLYEKNAFRGRAVSSKTEASLSLADVKRQAKSGQWNEAMPALLAITGLLGLLFFGSLTLFVALDDRIIGGLIAFAGVFTTLRVLIGLIRA